MGAKLFETKPFGGNLQCKTYKQTGRACLKQKTKKDVMWIIKVTETDQSRHNWMLPSCVRNFIQKNYT